MRPIQNLLDYFLKALLMPFVLVGTLVFCIFFIKMAGLACVTVLAAIFILPFYFGLLFGRFFRRLITRHLTAQFQSSPLLLFFILPIVYGAIEEQHFELTPRRAVKTQVVIEAPRSVVWKTLRFYEHVKRQPPLALRFGLPIPLKAIGNHKSVGEITSCEYEGGGFIRKKITKLIEQEVLAFDVIEQSIHFEHDLKLYGGSIELSSTHAGAHTVVTMTTHYESYVRPSWLWEPSMDYVIKSLHNYVIEDMQNDIERNVYSHV